MTSLIDCLNAVGECFDVQTGGYYSVSVLPNSATTPDLAGLRCELDDEIIVNGAR